MSPDAPDTENDRRYRSLSEATGFVAYVMRCAFRSGFPPHSGDINGGFRCVRSPD